MPARRFSVFARLTSVSANGYVDSTHPLIAGLYIGGGGDRRQLLRAAGPSLTNYGVTNPLTKPKLMLFNGSGQLLLTTSAWSGDSSLSSIFTELGAFPFAVGSADAAAVTTLAPGGYTIVVENAGGTGAKDGNSLAEVYDADYHRSVAPPAHPRALRTRPGNRGHPPDRRTLDFWKRAEDRPDSRGGPGPGGRGVPDALLTPS